MQYVEIGEQDDESETVGEEALERATAGMGGRVMAPPVSSAVTTLLSSPDPVHRRAAIAGLTRLAEGAHWLVVLHIVL